MFTVTQDQQATDVFVSQDHRSRFLETIQRIGKVYDGKCDPEYASALYILCAHAGTWQKVSTYVDRDGIDFETLLEEVDFSHGYVVLIQLAWHLFNGNIHIDPLEFLRLDHGNFQLALNALQMRRYGLRTDEVSSQKQGVCQ